MLTQPDPLLPRYLVHVQRPEPGAREGGLHELVLRDRGLRLWSRSRKAVHGGGDASRRHGARLRETPAGHHRLLLGAAAGASLPRQGGGTRQFPGRLHQQHEADIRVRLGAARPARRRSGGLRLGYRLAGPGGDPGSDGGRELVLGSGRGHACLRRPFRRADGRPHANQSAGQCLRGGDAFPACGGRLGPVDGWAGRGRPDEGPADGGYDLRSRHDPRRWPPHQSCLCLQRQGADRIPRPLRCKLEREVPAPEAYRPIDQGGCPLVRGG